MKKIALSVLLVAVLLFSACANEKNTDAGTNDTTAKPASNADNIDKDSRSSCYFPIGDNRCAEFYLDGFSLYPSGSSYVFSSNKTNDIIICCCETYPEDKEYSVADFSGTLNYAMSDWYEFRSSEYVEKSQSQKKIGSYDVVYHYGIAKNYIGEHYVCAGIFTLEGKYPVCLYSIISSAEVTEEKKNEAIENIEKMVMNVTITDY